MAQAKEKRAPVEGRPAEGEDATMISALIGDLGGSLLPYRPAADAPEPQTRRRIRFDAS